MGTVLYGVGEVKREKRGFNTMQNILIFPTKKVVKKSFIEKIQDFIEEKKAAKVAAYNKKILFLRQQTYIFYLKRALKARKNAATSTVDFPDFVYLSGAAISTDALKLANYVVDLAIKKGRRHIEKCFKKCVKGLEK